MTTRDFVPDGLQHAISSQLEQLSHKLSLGPLMARKFGFGECLPMQREQHILGNATRLGADTP